MARSLNAAMKRCSTTLRLTPTSTTFRLGKVSMVSWGYKSMEHSMFNQMKLLNSLLNGIGGVGATSWGVALHNVEDRAEL